MNPVTRAFLICFGLGGTAVISGCGIEEPTPITSTENPAATKPEAKNEATKKSSRADEAAKAVAKAPLDEKRIAKELAEHILPKLIKEAETTEHMNIDWAKESIRVFHDAKDIYAVVVNLKGQELNMQFENGQVKEVLMHNPYVFTVDQKRSTRHGSPVGEVSRVRLDHADPKLAKMQVSEGTLIRYQYGLAEVQKDLSGANNEKVPDLKEEWSASILDTEAINSRRKGEAISPINLNNKDLRVKVAKKVVELIPSGMSPKTFKAIKNATARLIDRMNTLEIENDKKRSRFGFDAIERETDILEERVKAYEGNNQAALIRGMLDDLKSSGVGLRAKVLDFYIHGFNPKKGSITVRQNSESQEITDVEWRNHDSHVYLSEKLGLTAVRSIGRLSLKLNLKSGKLEQEFGDIIVIYTKEDLENMKGIPETDGWPLDWSISPVKENEKANFEIAGQGYTIR